MKFDKVNFIPANGKLVLKLTDDAMENALLGEKGKDPLSTGVVESVGEVSKGESFKIGGEPVVVGDTLVFKTGFSGKVSGGFVLLPFSAIEGKTVR